MNITMANPGEFAVIVSYEGRDGKTFDMQHPVVAFDERGRPLVAGSQGLEHPTAMDRISPIKGWCMESVRRTVIPAQPGWVVEEFEDGVEDPLPYPVIAWIYEAGDIHIDEGSSIALGVCTTNRDGNVAFEEFDLTKAGVQVRYVGDVMTTTEATS